jgi:hypothetical protein
MENDSLTLKVKALIAIVRPIHVVATVLLLVILFFSYFFIDKYFQSHIIKTIQQEVVTASSTQALSPVRKEYKSVIPPSFLPTIPTEKKAIFSQSYELEYGVQKQSTIVFTSSKTVAENYTLYLSVLKNDGWTLAKEYSKPDVSFMYARKDVNEINITISKQDGKTSEVSISILKK